MKMLAFEVPAHLSEMRSHMKEADVILHQFAARLSRPEIYPETKMLHLLREDLEVLHEFLREYASSGPEEREVIRNRLRQYGEI